MALEEFYQSLYHDIFLKWILLNSPQYQKDTITCQVLSQDTHSTILLFDSEQVEGKITIWQNNIVEEEVIQKKKQNQLFYLHYTIVDLGQAKSLFKEFYHTLVKYNQQHLIKIAICSHDGLSTALFVEEIREIITLEQNNYIFDSLSLNELHQTYRCYDLLYLAPQLAEKEPDILILTKHLIPVHVIDATDFATKNYQSILKTIQKDLKR